MSNPRLYLIDGSGLCYRAYYALSNFATSYGQPTGAVFGFVNILNKILKDAPEYIVCCFDVSRETFRQKKYKEYKIQRPPAPQGLSAQMDLIKETVSAYNITVSELAGYEADDLIAGFARIAKENSWDTVIVSSDKDLLQLVDERVKVFEPKKEVWYDSEAVVLKYGLEPKRLIDAFSLMGDTSDNIPGVKGVGEKTATALIKEFGSVDSLIDNLAKLKSASLREALLKNIENIRLSYELFRLVADIPLDPDPEKLKRKEPDYEKLFLLFKKLEFNRLLKALPVAPEKEINSAVKVIPLEDDLRKKEILEQVRARGEFIFLIAQEESKVYFGAREDNAEFYSLAIDDEELRRVFSDPEIKKISHNLKDAGIFLSQNDIELNGLYFDTMLAAYLLEPSLASFDLVELAYKYLERRYQSGRISPEQALDVIIRINPALREKIEAHSLNNLLYELEIPLIGVLMDMQASGVKIDVRALAILSQELQVRLTQLVQEIYALNSGQEFNINSPKQLANVLFERLKLPVIKKTKTGLSTDEEVLRKLSKKHGLPLLLLEYRQLTKLKSTYIDSLPLLIDPKTRRIHAVFDQTGTETGRLSSNNPNLQNIPARGEIARNIRKAFIAEENNLLISADYSQIELRVLAHFSGDEALIRAFGEDRDIHKWTASLIFGVEESLVTDEMRETAKRINFGIVYGMGSFGLAKDLEIPVNEAQDFIDNYFLRYPKVNKFIESQIALAKDTGFVTTILGRRRYLPEINNKNSSLRSFAERQAVNSPIQGSAADLIKLAMVNIHQVLSEMKLKARLIMQIHDELVFEVPEAEFEAVSGLVRDRMENVYKLDVPVKVNIKKGKNWQEMVTAEARNNCEKQMFRGGAE